MGTLILAAALTGAASAAEAPSALADIERAAAITVPSLSEGFQGLATAGVPTTVSEPAPVRELKQPVTPAGEAALRPLVAAVVITLYKPENFVRTMADALGPTDWPFAAKFPKLLRPGGELTLDTPDKPFGFLSVTKRKDDQGGIVVSLRGLKGELMVINLGTRRFFVFRPDGRLFQAGTLDFATMTGKLD